MRNFDQLWESIRNLDFNDPVIDEQRRAIRAWKKQLLNGGDNHFEFSVNWLEVGGIHEVRRTISNTWTVSEVGYFRDVWNAIPLEEKEKMMGGEPKPTDAADRNAWEAWCGRGPAAYRRVEYFTFALKVVHEAALVAIGAKCYADCKRENTHVALALDAEPYYNQTPTELESTLPPPFVTMLHALQGAMNEMQGKMNEMQAAENLNAKNVKGLSAKMDVAAETVTDKLNEIKRQGEHNGQTLAEIRTDTATTAATMPDKGQWAQLLAAIKTAKKPDNGVSRANAAKILDWLCGHDSRFANLTGQRIGQYIKQGYCTHAPDFPLTEADLATKAAFVTWVQGMCSKVTAPKGEQIAVGSTIERADSRNNPDWGQIGIRPNITPQVMRQIQAL